MKDVMLSGLLNFTVLAYVILAVFAAVFLFLYQRSNNKLVEVVMQKMESEREYMLAIKGLENAIRDLQMFFSREINKGKSETK